MNKADECDIVKDLSLQYIENSVSSGSKQFIENHLMSCNKCQKYYDEMKKSVLEDLNVDENKENLELNYLKKIKKHMNIQKALIMIVLIPIIIICGANLIKYLSVNNVINQACNKIEELKKLDNYKLVQETTKINIEKNESEKNQVEYYYLNGKNKIKFGNTTEYIIDDKYNKIYVFDDLKQIDYYNQDYIEQTKGNNFNIFTEIINYNQILSGFNTLKLSINEDYYKGSKCYVLRTGNTNSHRDVWINEETSIVVRVIDEEYGKYYIEKEFTLEENIVEESDVNESILDTELYTDYKRETVDYKATKELRDILENNLR